MTTKEHDIKLLVQEMAEYMNQYKEGHVVVEVAKDEDEEIFYIADIVIHGYVYDGDEIVDTASRSFEVGYSNDKAIAEELAKKGHDAIKRIAVRFEVNEEIEYTNY